MRTPGTFTLSPRALEAFDLNRLCERAGVPASNAWDTSDFFALWTAAGQEIEDRAAGLRFGAGGIDGGYGVAAIVALHAPDFGAALSSLSRYKSLTCPELVEIESFGTEVVVRYRWLQATGAPPRLLVDTVLASLAALAGCGSGGRVAPVRVELSRRPADRALLERHFGCPVVFGATWDAMVFDRDALTVPFVTADSGAFGHVLEQLEARLGRGEGFSAFIGLVRVAIARQLSEGRPATVQAVSGRLGTSIRTLQRRLTRDRTSFQIQLGGVRRTTAGRLLADTDLDTTAISMLLGFEEPNSFARAFRGWEQTSPSRWREQRTAPAVTGELQP